jgi:1,4-dihydroxy-2-naphthoate octaprenyltransferase
MTSSQQNAIVPLVRPGSLAAWRAAMRPQSFPIAVVPVIVGSALAWALHDAFRGWVAALALAGAVLVQAITNLQNDVGYTVRGGETGTRSGLPRATANGWLSPAAVRAAILAAIAMSLIVAAPLVAFRGWPVVFIVASSIVAAWAYMGGPRPIAYTPFGEITVFAFFGVTAVCGTIYVQAGTVDGAGMLAGVAIGLLASAVLTVNNHRDIEHDRSTGRRTLSVVLGARRSRTIWRSCIVGAFALLPPIAWLGGSAGLLLPALLAPHARRALRAFDQASSGPDYTRMLFRTVLLEAAFGLLLAAGALLGRALAR